METYIDIATPAEIEDFFGYTPDAKELERKRLECEQDPDYNFANLAILYHFRGDKTRTKEYLNKIKSPERHLDTCMLLYECRLP